MDLAQKSVLSRGNELAYKKDIRTMTKCVIGENRAVRDAKKYLKKLVPLFHFLSDYYIENGNSLKR